MEGSGSHSSVKAYKGTVFFLPPPFNKTVLEHLSNALPKHEVLIIAIYSDGMPTMGGMAVTTAAYAYSFGAPLVIAEHGEANNRVLWA